MRNLINPVLGAAVLVALAITQGAYLAAGEQSPSQITAWHSNHDVGLTNDVAGCRVKTGGKVDREAAELIGTPVFAADGVEVGQVADVAFDEKNRPERLRITIETVLGFGARTVEIPRGAFLVLRGAVVLDLPAEAVQALPELTEQDEDK